MKIHNLLGIASLMIFVGFNTSATEINLEGLKLYSAELKPVTNNSKEEVVIANNRETRLLQFKKSFIKLTFTRSLVVEKVILLPVNFVIEMPKGNNYGFYDEHQEKWTMVIDQLDGKKLSELFDFYTTEGQSEGITSSASTNQLANKNGVRISDLRSDKSIFGQNSINGMRFAISERSEDRSTELVILEGGDSEANQVNLTEHSMKEFSNLVIP